MKFEELDASLEFKAEVAKLQFAMEVNSGLQRAGWSRSDLADRLGVSRALVTKMLRGDANVTIDTMVRLADVFGGTLFMKFVKSGRCLKVFEVVESVQATQAAASAEVRTAIEGGVTSRHWPTVTVEEYEAQPVAA